MEIDRKQRKPCGLPILFNSVPSRCFRRASAADGVLVQSAAKPSWIIICHTDVQRTKSWRRVRVTPLTRWCRARAGARTARPDEELSRPRGAGGQCIRLRPQVFLARLRMSASSSGPNVNVISLQFASNGKWKISTLSQLPSNTAGRMPELMAGYAFSRPRSTKKFSWSGTLAGSGLL